MNLEVRDAHLPAEIHQRHGTYEYLPTEDRVNVTIRCHLQPHLGTTYSIHG